MAPPLAPLGPRGGQGEGLGGGPGPGALVLGLHHPGPLHHQARPLHLHQGGNHHHATELGALWQRATITMHQGPTTSTWKPTTITRGPPPAPWPAAPQQSPPHSCPSHRQAPAGTLPSPYFRSFPPPHHNHHSLLLTTTLSHLLSTNPSPPTRVMLINMKVKTRHYACSHFVPHAMPFPKQFFFSL